MKHTEIVKNTKARIPASQDVKTREEFDKITKQVFMPEDENQKSYDEILKELEETETTPTIKLIGRENKEIQLPEQICEILFSIINDMSQGKAVHIFPTEPQLTTSEAANFLSISRPTLVKLLEEGKIPYEKVRRHRKVYLKHLIQFQEKQYKKQKEALAQLINDAQELGFYDYMDE